MWDYSVGEWAEFCQTSEVQQQSMRALVDFANFQANDVVFESAATRHLDIRQCQAQPLAFVDGPLAVHRPSHRGKRNAEGRAETRRCSK